MHGECTNYIFVLRSKHHRDTLEDPCIKVDRQEGFDLMVKAEISEIRDSRFNFSFFSLLKESKKKIHQLKGIRDSGFNSPFFSLLLKVHHFPVKGTKKKKKN